jgi:cytochrome P450
MPGCQLPPGPGLSPAEQTFRWFAHPYAFMEECRQAYGEVFTLELEGTGQHVLCSHPRDVKAVLGAERGMLRAGEGNAVWLSFMGPRSLLLLDGEAHCRERRRLAGAFHPARLQPLAALVAEAAGRMARALPTGAAVSLLPRLVDLSLEVILRALFGLAPGERLDGLVAAARDCMTASEFGIAATRLGSAELGPWDPWARFRTTAARLEAQIRSLVAEARQARGPAGQDILAFLLEAGLDEAELRDELVTLLMAGHETTACALAWAFHWALATPGVQERLREEAAAIEDPLCRPYLEAVVKESLRICPVIPMISRRVAADLTLPGAWVPAGANVSPAVYLAHRRPEAFPAPEVFRPERFLERRYSPAEYFPFGGGDRRCIGAELATLEMKVVLATVLDQVRLEVVEGHPPRPVRRNVNLAPAGGTRVRVLGPRRGP